MLARRRLDSGCTGAREEAADCRAAAHSLGSEEARAADGGDGDDVAEGDEVASAGSPCGGKGAVGSRGRR